MLKEELVEGIKQAVSKGEPIERAMMTFYSAGYSKQDIEEAAAAAQSPNFVMPQQPVQQPMQQEPLAQPRMVVPAPPATQLVQPGVVQRVSAYGPKPNKKGMAITIILIIVLLLLLGLLAAVILFKDEISNLFSSSWRALF